MKLKSLVLLLVLAILVTLGSFVWIVQHRSRAATVDNEATIVIPAPANDDMQMRKDFNDELHRDLEAENFTELDRIAGEIATQKSRFPGGDWKLMRFFEDIADPPSGEETEIVNWEKHLAGLEKWTKERPDSVYAVVALGDATIGYAWKLRGDGFASKVSTEDYNRFQQTLDQAEAILNRVSDRRKSCIAWYPCMQRIGMGKGWDLQRREALLDEAISVEPLYYDVYNVHAVSLLPRWYGKPGEWQQFADRTVSKMGGTEGSILYSQICWQISRFTGVKELYRDEHIKYPRVRDGFIKLTRTYGSSYRYLNAFALLSGTAGDVVTTRALMQKIGEHWEPDFWWHEKHYFDDFKKWAFNN